MRSVSARDANQGFSELLRRAEHGEEIVITKHGTPVAILSPFRKSALTPARRAAVTRAIRAMDELAAALARPVRHFTRDEMHER
jgi:prevent-host-death family protein